MHAPFMEAIAETFSASFEAKLPTVTGGPGLMPTRRISTNRALFWLRFLRSITSLLPHNSNIISPNGTSWPDQVAVVLRIIQVESPVGSTFIAVNMPRPGSFDIARS